jgi:ribosomal protein S14
MTKPNTNFDYGNLPYECLTEANYNLRFQNQITDFRKRTHFRNWELSMLINKTCVETNHSLIEFNSKFKLSKRYQIKKSSKVRIKNRCILSTRSSTIKPFRISRIYFRSLANLGQLPGVSKRTNR